MVCRRANAAREKSATIAKQNEVLGGTSQFVDDFSIFTSPEVWQRSNYNKACGASMRPNCACATMNTGGASIRYPGESILSYVAVKNDDCE